jgi:glycosyltransferase involved in cell wall biosynthesis
VKKIKASVCILTKNEEENLPRCLEPLSDFEEIIVLDSGSTDNTIKVAREHGARVVEKPWDGFGATRRLLFAEATQPWIFWIDADEVASEELVDEIRNCVEADPVTNGYMVNRITWIGRKRFRHGNWYPDWNIRFFRRTEWTMEERDVHESVKISGGVGRFLSRMEHYSYRNWDERKTRAQRYAKLWASQAFRDGKRVTFFDQVGHACASFVKGFIFKLGFLDGISGLRLALSNSSEVADKYRRLRKAWEKFGGG